MSRQPAVHGIEDLRARTSPGHESTTTRRSAVVLLVALAAALSLTAPPASAGPVDRANSVTTTDVSFRSHGHTLHGTVLAPRDTGVRRPGLVLVHGSGTGTPRTELWREAEEFAARGIVTLIYDKRATGYSPTRRDFSLLADDALAGVAKLRARSDVDPAAVGVWGLSEGGWVAPIAAARSETVAFLIVVGANGINPARQQAWAIANRLAHLGIRGSMQDTFSTTAIRTIVGAGLFAQADHDPVPVLERVRQPMLGIWGGKDRSTPAGEALTTYRRVFERTGNQHVTLRVFPDGDHALHRSTDDGFKRLDVLVPGYADLVASWVLAVAGGRPPASSADPAPQQDRQSVALSPLAVWEAPWLQIAVLVTLVMAFLGYPVTAALGRLRRGRPRRRRRLRHGRPRLSSVGTTSARWLVVTGIATVIGFAVVFVAVCGTQSVGPVLAGRSVVWLALQLLSVGVVVSAVATAVAWWRAGGEITRARRVRLGLLLTGASVFVPWAIHWGLLLP